MNNEAGNLREFNLRELKQQAKVELGGLDGIEGFGIGDERLIAYVRDGVAALQLPDLYHGVAIETVVTGEIRAQHDAAESV